MKRYNVVFNQSYQPELMVEEKDGDYVEYEDAAARIGELLEALEGIMNQTDGRNNYVIGHDRAYAIARAAIAKAKGEQP